MGIERTELYRVSRGVQLCTCSYTYVFTVFSYSLQFTATSTRTRGHLGVISWQPVGACVLPVPFSIFNQITHLTVPFLWHAVPKYPRNTKQASFRTTTGAGRGTGKKITGSRDKAEVAEAHRCGPKKRLFMQRRSKPRIGKLRTRQRSGCRQCFASARVPH